jgi:hypothetical protein
VRGLHVPLSGLSYAPQLEWRLAAAWAHYPYHQFQRLEGAEQARIVAAYRLKNKMDALLAHEQLKAAQRKT